MTSAFGMWLVKIWETFEVKNKKCSVKLTSLGLWFKPYGTVGILRGSHQDTK